MLFTKSLVGASLIAGALSLPLTSVSDIQNDGFPTPNDAQLKQIEIRARGTLPNGPPPPPGAISKEGITNLQLIAFNEIFEQKFFASMYGNVTNNVKGFEIEDQDERQFILEVLDSVIAQEELHLLNANGALKSQNQQPIQPCQYAFPTTNFWDAIALASTFTDVVLGTLQDVTQIFAQNKDVGLTRGVASVIGQEGEQNGFYRVIQKHRKLPSALPFLTTSIRDFAFSALQGFVVPGSCPNSNIIPLKIFGVLNLLTPSVEAKDQDLQFSFDIKSLEHANILNATAWSATTPSGGANGMYSPSYDWSSASLVYINQQNTPVVEQPQNVKVDGTVVSFTAKFPFTENEMNGLTLAAVTKNAGPFANAQAVADATIFAPALIEVN